MNIEIDIYKLQLSEKELWVLAFALAHKLTNEDTIKHCAFHDGMRTFKFNYNDYEVPMHKMFSVALQRPELHTELLKEVEAKITKETIRRERKNENKSTD